MAFQFDLLGSVLAINLTICLNGTSGHKIVYRILFAKLKVLTRALANARPRRKATLAARRQSILRC